MLRFADELLLLLVDDRRGDLIPIPEWSLSCALAGALLMDLALEGRIDTDPDALSLLDATPLDDDLLDPVLEEIAGSDALRTARFWVSHFAERGDVRDRALARHGDAGHHPFKLSRSRTIRYRPAFAPPRNDAPATRGLHAFRFGERITALGRTWGNS